MPLIQGCINPIIKQRLVVALDQGCKTETKGDPMCKEFRTELTNLPDCHAQTAAPAKKEHKKIPFEQMSPFQKHMSVCLTELRKKEVPPEVPFPSDKRSKAVTFDWCIYKWKIPEQRLDDMPDPHRK